MNAEKIGINKKTLPILAICLILGIIFLCLSEYSGFERTAGEEVFDEEAYTDQIQTRLEEILERMDGVSQVKVMITLESSETHDWAAKVAKSSEKDATSIETYLLMQEDASGKNQPILNRTLFPKIRGASVVCKGAGDPTIQRKIIRLVSSTLNLNENQIFVTQ